MWDDTPLDISPEDFEREIESMFRIAGPQMEDFQILRRPDLINRDVEYEIDILVTFRALDGVKFKVLVECKRHIHRIKRDLVQVFHHRRERLGAQKGILFSTVDFQKGAVSFAETHGISLALVKKGDTTWFTRSAVPLREPPEWADPSLLAAWFLRSEKRGLSFSLATAHNPGALKELIDGWLPVRKLPSQNKPLQPPQPRSPATPKMAMDAAIPERHVYRVWFGTNRKPNEEGTGFTSERHDSTTLGRAEVFIPKAHRFGETGSPFWRRLLRFDIHDDHLILKKVEHLSSKDYLGEIQAELQEARRRFNESHALIFLHGFNVGFEEAAIRAAQIGLDLRIPGATAFFSWPSMGNVKDYLADEASIEASEGAITGFLTEFLDQCGADKVHVIAHSMGNRGLLRALHRIAANTQRASKNHFDQIILAAPDVDRDVFMDLARVYPPHSKRTTLYSSDADKAVHLSALIHEHPRAGYFMPYTTVEGIDTIAVPHFDLDLLGHSYFASSSALLHDIFNLTRHNEEPSRRQRLASLQVDGQEVWQLQR